MAALGEDGGGYELALKLESLGIWRRWLGDDTLYSTFLTSLSSPSSWHSFLSLDHSKSTPHIHLQLRVRALLFDKASSLSISSLSSLNPSCLQLHGDDVYFTLEDAVSDQKVQSQRGRQEDFPETWYNQLFENYRTSKPYLFSFANRERNPSEMLNYLRHLERYKRRRVELKKDEYGGLGNNNSESRMQQSTVLGDDALSDDDTCFFPETMYAMNCVPDRAIAPRAVIDEDQKLEVFGVLDTLPQVTTKSSIMLERLGIRPEYLSMEQGAGPSRTKVGLNGNRKQLSQEQASVISKKVVARFLTSMGFEGGSEVSIEVLSQFLSCHISKLGGILKVLADSYRKQCSAMDLIKMFFQAPGNRSNLASLVEYVKDCRNVVQPSAQQMPNMHPQSMQPQLPLSQQNTLQLPQQIPRQMHPQMSQIHSQNMTLQQQQQQLQLERMRRRQASSPRPVMSMDKDRPMVEVKLENPPDLPMDGNTFSTINHRPNQMQLRQQQIAALQRIMGASGNQMRLPVSMQMPSVQSQNIGSVRAPPVKVEGFQELMGGDASLKQNSDESRLTSPSK